jgi:chorismate dehydratase
MPDRLRVGRIAYTNVTPVETAFDTGAVARVADIVTDVPSALNAALDARELDAGPMSAAQYLRHQARYVRLGDIGIIARREVLSVLLVSPTPPSLLDGAAIAVTRDSASGRALLEALLNARYGVRATFPVSDDPLGEALAGKPALLIGDAALDAREAFPPEHVHDLGLAWNAWTALPMVFAVWVVRREIAAARPDEVATLADAYARARAWGEAHPAEIVAAATRVHPRATGFYERYFTTLDYHVDASAEAGLTRFAEVIGVRAGVYDVA